MTISNAFIPKNMEILDMIPECISRNYWNSHFLFTRALVLRTLVLPITMLL